MLHRTQKCTRRGQKVIPVYAGISDTTVPLGEHIADVEESNVPAVDGKHIYTIHEIIFSGGKQYPEEVLVRFPDTFKDNVFVIVEVDVNSEEYANFISSNMLITKINDDWEEGGITRALFIITLPLNSYCATIILRDGVMMPVEIMVAERNSGLTMRYGGDPCVGTHFSIMEVIYTMLEDTNNAWEINPDEINEQFEFKMTKADILNSIKVLVALGLLEQQNNFSCVSITTNGSLLLTIKDDNLREKLFWNMSC